MVYIVFWTSTRSSWLAVIVSRHVFVDPSYKYIVWFCKVNAENHTACAQSSCGTGDEAKSVYFPNGRAPSGTPLQKETLRQG